MDELIFPLIAVGSLAAAGLTGAAVGAAVGGTAVLRVGPTSRLPMMSYPREVATWLELRGIPSGRPSGRLAVSYPPPYYYPPPCSFPEAVGSVNCPHCGYPTQ